MYTFTAACPKCRRELTIELDMPPGTQSGVVVTCDHCGATKRLKAFQKEIDRQKRNKERAEQKEIAAQEWEHERLKRIEEREIAKREREERRRAYWEKRVAIDQVFEEEEEKRHRTRRNYAAPDWLQARTQGPLPKAPPFVENSTEGWGLIPLGILGTILVLAGLLTAMAENGVVGLLMVLVGQSLYLWIAFSLLFEVIRDFRRDLRYIAARFYYRDSTAQTAPGDTESSADSVSTPAD